MMKFKDTIRHKTRRTNGRSLQSIIVDVNASARGWYEYFKHSWKTVFPGLDGYIRGRLRSILRKRAGRSGRGRGLDHHRYPNALFADHGLLSLAALHARESQSLKRKPKA